MTVGELRELLAVLPDHFSVRIEAQSDTPVLIRTMSVETGSLVLRQHVLTIDRVVDTITAFDGSEYQITVKNVNYPKVIQLPHPIHSQLRRSVDKLGNPA